MRERLHRRVRGLTRPGQPFDHDRRRDSKTTEARPGRREEPPLGVLRLAGGGSLGSSSLVLEGAEAAGGSVDCRCVRPVNSI